MFFLFLILFGQLANSVSIQQIYTENVHSALAMGLDEVEPGLRPIPFTNIHDQLVLLEIENSMSGGLTKNEDLKPMNCHCKFIPVDAKLGKNSGKNVNDAASEAKSNSILESIKQAKEEADKKKAEAEKKEKETFEETSKRNQDNRDTLEEDLKDREAAQKLQEEKQFELNNDQAFDRDNKKHITMRKSLEEDISEDENSFITLQSQIRPKRQ